MSDKKIFQDNSSLEWVNRETLKYVEGEYVLFIWVDYFAYGVFSSGRVIKASSMKEWNSKPENSSPIIDNNKKLEIIDKIKKYYPNKKIRIEGMDLEPL